MAAERRPWKWFGRIADTATIIQVVGGGTIVSAISKFILSMPSWQAAIIGINAAFLIFAFGYVIRLANKNLSDQTLTRLRLRPTKHVEPASAWVDAVLCRSEA